MLSVHPLQSFADLDGGFIKNLPGSVFSIEGDKAAYHVGGLFSRNPGGEYFFIDRKAKAPVSCRCLRSFQLSDYGFLVSGHETAEIYWGTS